MRLIPSLVVAVTVVACSDSFNPTIENVAGDYVLQTLITTDTAGTIDWRTRGATLTITLAPNGTTTGNLFIPGAGEGGADVNADLAGSWSVVGKFVSFTQAADTFVRDMTWTAILGGLLAAEQSFGGTLVRVQIQK